MDKRTVIEDTREWITSMVIGLNLCPFARSPFEGERIRYFVSEANDGKKLLSDLGIELGTLAAAPIDELETTLLIHPNALPDFFDYNDFLGVANQLIEALGLSGVIQIASFHPDYQFAETAAEAVENYTNRSPYPMLHLLREASVSRIAMDPEALLEIPERNIQTLKDLGLANVLKRLKLGT